MKRSLPICLFILLASTRLFAQAISVNFTADKQVICPGDSVRFIPTIAGPYTSVLWAFPGGSPSSSTTLSPKITYNTPGTYSVTLSARNATDTATKTSTAYITVSRGQQLAINEGFQGATFPPAGWQLARTSNFDWALSTTVGGYGTSTRSMVYNNFTNNSQGKTDRIIAPKVDLTGVTAARLTFNVAYAPYGATFPDSLQVRISTDCGNTWTVAYTKTGTALATAPTFTAGTFVPTAAQWRTDTVSLTPYVNNPVLVSFDNIGHFGQAIYIDNVNILPAPLAAFSSSDTAVCVGTAITFSDSSKNATGWSWSFAGGTPSSSIAQNPTVIYSTPGYYSVVLTAVNPVGTGVINKTSYIHVSSLPVVNITQTGFLLNATSTPGTYQWYLNNAPIPGATSPTLLAGTTGSYKVVVNNSGCSGTSASFWYRLLNVNNIANDGGFAVFPNPSNGLITIKAEGLTSNQVTVQCYNVAGQIVRAEVVKVTNGVANTSYDWSNLPKGMYQLRFTTLEGGSSHANLILQ